MLTNLEVIDLVTKHLLCQNKRSATILDGKSMCLYRGPDGTKCAVGVLIPDEEYSVYFENKIPVHLDCPSLRDIDLAVLNKLQAIHDNVDPAQWGFKLAALRRLYDKSRSV